MNVASVGNSRRDKGETTLDRASTIRWRVGKRLSIALSDQGGRGGLIRGWLSSLTQHRRGVVGSFAGSVERSVAARKQGMQTRRCTYFGPSQWCPIIGINWSITEVGA
jgi:hypothetical protein